MSAVWYTGTPDYSLWWSGNGWVPVAAQPTTQPSRELQDFLRSLELSLEAIRSRREQGGSVSVTVTAPAPSQKEGKPMKTVFNVVVVSKKGEILLDKKVVAKDRDEALFEADVSSVLKAKGLKPSDATMLAVTLGNVEIEPEPQKVQIVGKDA